MEPNNFAPGFCTQDRELRYDQLTVEGDFPEWLSGSLLRTGPALFELEHQSYNHWYDGLAMLYKFSFSQGNVGFTCKYLQSEAYLKARENGKAHFKEWATDPCKTIFEQAMSYFVAPNLTDNGNINIISYGEELLATSETPLPVIFDKDNLDTKGRFEFDDDLNGHIDPAHPHYDAEGNVYSYLLKYGLLSTYQIYRMQSGSRKREVIAEISTRQPAYMHSFAKTENYLILTEFPFIVSPMELKFGDKPLIENYHWKPEEGTQIQVIDLNDGSVSTYQAPAFFAFHHVNAYEEKDQVIIDVVTFENADVVRALYLDELRSNRHTHAAGYLSRITIDLSGSQEATMHRLSGKLLELPRINYAGVNACPYRFAYGAGNTQPGNWLDDITKIDVETGEFQVWHAENCYPSEPVFVASPHSQQEDEGVLLSVVLDADAQNTFLLVLDAQSMQELARARVPEILPFSFHGNFYHD